MSKILIRLNIGLFFAFFYSFYNTIPLNFSSTFSKKLPCADYTATHLPVWELHPFINSFPRYSIKKAIPDSMV